MSFNRQERRIMVREARALVARFFPDAPPAMACLYHAWAIIQVAAQHRHKFILLAGTAYWPRLAAELDDGIEPDVFGYQWEGGEPRGNVLPEMHVWAGCPATAEYIDLTTRYWPEQCRVLTGMSWKAPAPPDYLWAKPQDFAPKVQYRPYREASHLAGRLLIETFGAMSNSGK